MRRCTEEKWELIRAAYVAGETDLAALAKRFRVWEPLIAARCAADRWPAERDLVGSEERSRSSNIAVQVDAWKRERIRAGRLGLINVLSILEEKRQDARTLAWLMVAANRALPAQVALPEESGAVDADLVVIEAGGDAWDESAGRQAPDALAPESGRAGRLLPKPK